MGGNTIKKEIDLEIKRLENELKKAKREISLLPKGTLRCTSSNGTDQYFIDGTYISKIYADDNLLEALAKCYMKK